jgi:hypothetical protein
MMCEPAKRATAREQHVAVTALRVDVLLNLPGVPLAKPRSTQALCFRLLRRAGQTYPVLACSKVSGQNLQRNFAIKFCVLRQITSPIPPAPIFETMR